MQCLGGYGLSRTLGGNRIKDVHKVPGNIENEDKKGVACIFLYKNKENNMPFLNCCSTL